MSSGKTMAEVKKGCRINKWYKTKIILSSEHVKDLTRLLNIGTKSALNEMLNNHDELTNKERVSQIYIDKLKDKLKNI
jgi:hypothetical protein